MLKKLLNNKLRAAIVIALVLLLTAVRYYEDVLFYDPFLEYFKGEYLNLPFPKFDGCKLFFGLTVRYFLNAIISIAIIHTIFRDFPLTKFAAFLYLIFSVILITAFFALINFSDSSSNFILFYIRRFLIQPIFLLLFIPAFFYQKQNS